jgi:preprotein translocase subunit SecG
VTSPIVIAYFTIIVFAGAFFLLNLTLAVINSKFTEAHNSHQSNEKDKLSDNLKSISNEDDEMNNLL